MSDDIRTGSHVTEESTDCLHEAIQGLEQVIMCHTTTHMFPEALDGIQIGRVSRQTDQPELISMLSEPGLYW